MAFRPINKKKTNSNKKVDFVLQKKLNKNHNTNSNNVQSSLFFFFSSRNDNMPVNM